MFYATCLLVAASGICYFIYALYKARSLFRQLQEDGCPMPPHHPLLGHLGLMMEICLSLPRDVIPTVVLADQIRRRYPHLDRAFYLDLWPFSLPSLMVISPDLMRQVSQTENSLPKVAFLKAYMKPISGGHDIVTMEGEEWKRWKDVFRPGFSQVTELVPAILENIHVFRDLLANKSKIPGDGGAFQLHHSALLLAMDMSGSALWGHDLQSQSRYNDMADAIISQLRWLLVEGFMPFAGLNFVRPLVHWYNASRMERYLRKVQTEKKTTMDNDHCIIDRAIAKVKHREGRDKFAHLGGRSHFDKVIRSQMRFFLLAGYDTTGSTITYALHLLSQHPKDLARVREEHDQVLGRDLTLAAQRLREDPHMINRVPYTTAVIKETLRLYPPASTIRHGREGFYLYEREKQGPGQMAKYPTAGFMVFGNHHGLHHNPRYWIDPEEFLPERFLVGNEGRSRLSPVQDAWRPFEKGPRVCMGQELAMVEIKAVLMLVVREFDISPAYDEWDKRMGQEKCEAKVGWGALLPSSTIRHVAGDRVYQTTGGGGSHPADGYPCRVRIAKDRRKGACRVQFAKDCSDTV
ncbi:hypothetical protein EG327_011641 [Venturia inaequalis]|uniref:Cytochrome P450 n=1 Tax=Venturia inaequalis TaxID=5025 RepID=A0A8H3UAS9_VENIN|nr:hypothetical protein EG327_011641 [Venturia inaequalis]